MHAHNIHQLILHFPSPSCVCNTSYFPNSFLQFPRLRVLLSENAARDNWSQTFGMLSPFCSTYGHNMLIHTGRKSRKYTVKCLGSSGLADVLLSYMIFNISFIENTENAMTRISFLESFIYPGKNLIENKIVSFLRGQQKWQEKNDLISPTVTTFSNMVD